MKFGTFDIEASNRSGMKLDLNIDFEVLGFFDGESYYKFLSVKKFLDSLDKKAYQGFRIFAHNGGKYDFLFLLEELWARGWVQKVIERTGRIIAIKIDTGRVSFTLADSFALLPQSLRKLAESFNVDHQKTEIDYKQVSATDEKTLLYLEQDVRCLYDVLNAFFSHELIDTPQLTIASQALNTFRTKFQTATTMQRVELPEEQMFRDMFYAGGRCEVYKGAGKVKVYDVNSLFPSVMLQKMPCGNVYPTKSYQKGRIGFYHVKIRHTPDWYISPLLVKLKTGNFYVKGPGEYNVSSAMLEYLKKEFAVQFEVVSGWFFEGSDYLFNDYVTALYKMKSSFPKSSAGYWIAKYLLNALYGKFGQSTWHDTLVNIERVKGDFKEPDSEILKNYGMVLVEERSRSKYIMPYLAAYITDLARLKHFQLMQEAPHSMYYGDTDSLFTTHNYDRYVSKAIGQLSFEGEYDGVFISPKCYALKKGKEEKVAFKGFSTEEFSFADFKRSASTMKPLTQKRQRMLSYRECLKRKAAVAYRAGRFLVLVDQKKKVEKRYDKRLTIPRKSGIIFETEPLQYVHLSPNASQLLLFE